MSWSRASCRSTGAGTAPGGRGWRRGDMTILKGVVEILEPANIRGWTYLTDQADVHLEVKASVNGDLIGSGRADIMRKDLAEAGIGRGDHAFDIRLDKAVAQEDLRRVEVLAVVPTGQE